MSRSTNILGFAFLALAATLALSITLRNSPEPAKEASHPGSQAGSSASARSAPLASGRAAALRRQAARNPAADPLKVSVSDAWLATLSPDERQDWLDRAAAVEREASGQLDKLTTSLDLNSTQRRKLFPALVRASAGYDPAMTVAGASVAGNSTLTPAEEIHSLLAPDQQAQLEDNEVQRQLWWQDIIDKLEVDLTNSTGGAPAGGAPAGGAPAGGAPAGGAPAGGATTPAEPVPGDTERVAPEARDDGNLFDLLAPR
ncbi:MAG: hypothetical protein K9N23_02005 [Akkermansiaceae bacterium]|nr:hypothetical protein [Akkermansiaceae bacterium]MCF7730425.1 hypothetical protein [Akkermansiaceae bacterium]